MSKSDQELQRRIDAIWVNQPPVSSRVREALAFAVKQARFAQAQGHTVRGFVVCNVGLSCECGGIVPVGEDRFDEWKAPTTLCRPERRPSESSKALHAYAADKLPPGKLRRLYRNR